jgi:hypothetical protein
MPSNCCCALADIGSTECDPQSSPNGSSALFCGPISPLINVKTDRLAEGILRAQFEAIQSLETGAELRHEHQHRPPDIRFF